MMGSPSPLRLYAGEERGSPTDHNHDYEQGPIRTDSREYPEEIKAVIESGRFEKISSKPGQMDMRQMNGEAHSVSWRRESFAW